MGYIRMVRSGGLHCVSNAIRQDSSKILIPAVYKIKQVVEMMFVVLL